MSFRCVPCRKTFSHRFRLRNHFLTKAHRRQTIDEVIYFYCGRCGYRSNQRAYLYRHKKKCLNQGSPEKIIYGPGYDEEICERYMKVILDKRIDLNKFFNYNYYIDNWSDLSGLEKYHLQMELKFVHNLLT